MLFCFIALCLVNAGNNQVEERDLQFGDYNVRILGQSGKMTLWNSEKTMQLDFQSLKELDADGNEAFNSHGFQSFATQDFEFDAPENGSWPADDCCGPSAVPYTKITFRSTVATNQAGQLGQMWVETLLFHESGRIIVNDGLEKFDVAEGVMKWTVGINDWQWCVDQCCNGNPNNCNAQNSAVGEFLKLQIDVKFLGGGSRRQLQIDTDSPTLNPTTEPSFFPTVDPTFNPTGNPTSPPSFNPTMSPTANPTSNPSNSPTLHPTLHPTLSPVEANFNFGNDTSMVISNYVKLGDEETVVPLPDFIYEETGNAHSFSFVFPKSDKIMYDPIASVRSIEALTAFPTLAPTAPTAAPVTTTTQSTTTTTTSTQATHRLTTTVTLSGIANCADAIPFLEEAFASALGLPESQVTVGCGSNARRALQTTEFTVQIDGSESEVSTADTAISDTTAFTATLESEIQTIVTNSADAATHPLASADVTSLSQPMTSSIDSSSNQDSNSNTSSIVIAVVAITIAVVVMFLVIYQVVKSMGSGQKAENTATSEPKPPSASDMELGVAPDQRVVGTPDALE